MDPTYLHVAPTTLRSTEYVECTKFWQEHADRVLRAQQDACFHINHGNNCNPLVLAIIFPFSQLQLNPTLPHRNKRLAALEGNSRGADHSKATAFQINSRSIYPLEATIQDGDIPHHRKDLCR